MKFFNKHKNILILFFITTFLSLFILLPYIITDKQFVIGWDMRTQYSSFFEELRTMLKQIPFYSYNYFLGNNFYSSKLFYYHDIFDYVFSIFTNLSYYKIIIIQTYIKLIIASFSFYIYSKYNNYNEKTSLIGSLCFSFSSFILEEIKDPFFLSFTIFIPLYFLYIDKYIKENKKIGFILISSFLLITNYYLFYSLSVFSIIYFLYRYHSINNSFKNIIKSIFDISLCYLIAVLISSFSTIPQFYNIISNSRIGNKSILLLYDNLNPYINILTSWFTPTHIFTNRQDELSILFFTTTKNNSVLALYLFSSSIQTLLLPQIILNSKTKEKILYTILYSLIIFPIGSSLMHGFSEPSFRWVQFIVFMNISLSLKYIQDLNLINKKLLKNTLLFIILLFCISTIFYITKLNIKNTITLLCFTGVFIVFMILNSYLLNENKLNLILVLLTIELSISSISSFYLNPYYRQFNKNMIKSVSHTLLNKDDLNNYLLNLDESNKTSFYRVYVDTASVYWDYSTNLNLNYNLKGLMTYDSTVSSSISDMNNFIDIKSYLPWSYEIHDYRLLNLLSVKYSIGNSENIPFKNYKEVGEFNYFKVYENIDYVNFGKTYTKVSNKKDINLINSHIITNNNKINNYEYSNEKQIDTVNTYNNHINININTNSKQFLIISIPFDKGWKIILNNKKIEYFNVNGGLIGFEVEEGINNIDMYFIPYGLKQGIVFTIIGIVAFLMILIKEKINQNKQPL